MLSSPDPSVRSGTPAPAPTCLFSLAHIEAFREVAEHGNLTRAAVALQLSKSTVSKYMTDLEAQVGVKLLHRSTRAVSLTQAGCVLLRRSRSLVDLTVRIHSELRAQASFGDARTE